jgi:hypothetical protein
MRLYGGEGSALQHDQKGKAGELGENGNNKLEKMVVKKWEKVGIWW